MATCKYFFCGRYGKLADSLCPSLDSDDYDELEDPCAECRSMRSTTIEMDTLDVMCTKDYDQMFNDSTC